MLPGLGGCGGGEGVGAGAVLTVYVSTPLSGGQFGRGRAICAGAKRELARSKGRAGSVSVRVLCLDDAGGAGRWTLAAVGADARRAVEDSSTIGYIGELDPTATRFSRPIVEAAGIPQLSTRSGLTAMRELLGAIRRAASASSSGTFRESVRTELR
ncbi:MAG: hypothetical protein WBM00_11195 [Solirubrobacterales bacterium]